MGYAIAFFGIIIGAGFAWRIAAGDFPKGIPLVIIWIVALAVSFYLGYRRFYSGGESQK